MSVSRFNNFYSPQYSPEPDQALLQVGMMEKQDLGKNLELLQQSADYLGSIPSFGVRDTQWKNEEFKKAQDQVNSILKDGQSLKDPTTAYKINAIVHDTVNSPKIKQVVSDYQNHIAFQKSIQDRKNDKTYSDINADPLVQEWVHLAVDPNAPVQDMSPYTNVDPYKDWRQPIKDMMDKMKDSGGYQKDKNGNLLIQNTPDGQFVYTTSGKGISLNTLYKNGISAGYLSAQDVDQFQREAQYHYNQETPESLQKLSKTYKQNITPGFYAGEFLKGTVADIAPFYAHYNDDVSGLTGNGDYEPKPKTSPMEVADQGKSVTIPDILGFNIDDAGKMVTTKGPRWNEKEAKNMSTGSPFASAFQGIMDETKEIGMKDLSPEQRAKYDDLARVVKEANPTLSGARLNGAIRDYVNNYEQNGLISNPVLHAFDVSTSKAQTAVDNLNHQMFEFKKDSKGQEQWTGRGLILHSKVYDAEHPEGISGTEFIKNNKDNIIPLVMGDYTADNPTKARGGNWFQDKNGGTHYLETDQRIATDPIAGYANEMYQAKNSPTGTNYFKLNGNLVKSTYNKATDQYELSHLNDSYQKLSSISTDYNTLRTPEDLLNYISKLPADK